MKIEGEIKMTFDYGTLSQAAKKDQRLGNWNGKGVFAASVWNLENLGSNFYYILYDDENKIVAKTSNGWKSYGEVSESGRVKEYSSARNYNIVNRLKNYATEVSSGVKDYSPGYNVSEKPTGDVKLEYDIENVLKQAREMTIESFLKGFLSGVNYNVEKN